MIKALLQKLVSPKAHFVLGEGKVLAQSGEFEGRPAVILAPASRVGEPGTDARYERSSEFADVLRDSVILTFPTEARRDTVFKALFGQ